MTAERLLEIIKEKRNKFNDVNIMTISNVDLLAMARVALGELEAYAESLVEDEEVRARYADKEIADRKLIEIFYIIPWRVTMQGTERCQSVYVGAEFPSDDLIAQVAQNYHHVTVERQYQYIPFT